MIHEKKFQNKLAKYIDQKVQTLWPSGSGNNPMTEANLLLCTMELLRDEGFENFMEVPFYENGSNRISGRYDGVAIKKNTMLIIEAKSDKPNWSEAIVGDFVRIEKYKKGNIPFIMSKNIDKIFVYSIYWTETLERAMVFQKMKKENVLIEPFNALKKEGLFIECTEIKFDPKYYENSYWINLIGRQIL